MPWILIIIMLGTYESPSTIEVVYFLKESGCNTAKEAISKSLSLSKKVNNFSPHYSITCSYRDFRGEGE